MEELPEVVPEEVLELEQERISEDETREKETAGGKEKEEPQENSQ